MDIYAVLTLFGGLALFLFGMTAMSSGLEKLAGGSLEKIIGRMTANRIFGLLLGCGVTMVIQSSSATTVMLVGLVNSGIMKLAQSVSVIMGANIGTTITAWLLSMIGLESDNIVLRLLKPDSLSAICALIGMGLMMFSRKDNKKSAGGVLLGFAILMFGMNIMSATVKPLANIPEFKSVLTMFTNPLLGVLAGVVFTAVIQSSSASVGILQALTLTGGITYGIALPIIMGQNIGTCITSALSSIGASKNAKRVAAVHVWFNVIGTVIFMCVYAVAYAFIGKQLGQTASPFGIAVSHSIFNVATTLILLPFTRQLEKIAIFTVPDRKSEPKAVADSDMVIPDERLLLSPSFAIAECKKAVSDMAVRAKNNIATAFDNLKEYTAERDKIINEREDTVDKYEDKLGTYLVRLSAKPLTQADSAEASLLLHVIGDLERISDHAVNLTESAKEIHDKRIEFSVTANSEIKALCDSTLALIESAAQCFADNNISAASDIIGKAGDIRGLCSVSRAAHIERLRKGECTIESGFVFSDLLSSFARAADHCIDIAECVMDCGADAAESGPKIKTPARLSRMYDLYYMD